MLLIKPKFVEKCISRRFFSDGNVIKPFESIPGPKSLPILGTLHKYLPYFGPYHFDRLHKNGLKKLNKFGPIVREEIVPGVFLVWLFKPEDIETLFRVEGKYPQRRSHLALEKYRLDRPNVYNTGGLLPTNGPEWWRLRRVFQKGLSSPSAVQNFLAGTNDVMHLWLRRINDLKSTEKYDYLPELSRLFLELTCLATLDIRLDSFSYQELKSNSRSSKLMQAALNTNKCVLKTDNGLQIWKKIDTPLYRKLKRSQKYMEEVAIDLLSLKMSLFNDGSRNTPTLLQSYLSSPELDFKDIIGMVCDFLLAGIDTTTYSSCFLLYHIAKNSPVQCLLYEEAKKLLPTTNSPVTMEVLAEAHYAKAVLKESLRLRPISIGIGRVLEDDAEFSNYHVPKGTVVVSQNQVSCRLEQYFPTPHEFKPERWLKDHPLYMKPHPYLLLPFGHGPRACIARRMAEQNMLVLMLKLIRNYKIQWRGNILDSRSLLINKPDGPINLKFTKRE
ncbi:PREDICTED: cytochrome P450 302a1, mitochondrial [Nicrophorus vespilloides]|uniref:Cytochrome P450 302a1, mitochondrial n=1 Tax=Nicrophorus vespilloides TaxID=110193 RepID=A0ABM1NIZ9_NICVS|nr:PREDICTED: cytochrome P450 302a1, mitochondrial [Nicrophorus vespilloides]